MVRAIFFILAGMLFAPSIHAQQEAEMLLSGIADEETVTALPADIQDEYGKIDNDVLSLAGARFDTPEQLVWQFVNKYPDDHDRVRGIYTWVALNIIYDDGAGGENSKQEQKALHVWKTKKAVCEGYANLFNEICRLAGIESRSVVGYVPNADGSPLRYPNHVWNSVKIDGKWHLLDVTWASLALRQSNRDGEFDREHLDRFFLINPKDLIFSHLPEDPYWQLQDHYVSLEQFEQGEASIRTALGGVAEPKNFEAMIASYERLDSLGRTIALFERMEENKWNKAREYNLGIAYFYKAQEIIARLRDLPDDARKRAKVTAKKYYEKSLDYLALIDERDRGYKFSQALSGNVTFRIETLQ